MDRLSGIHRLIWAVALLFWAGSALGEQPLPDASPTPAPEPISITISAAGDTTLGGDPRNDSKAKFDRVYQAKGEDYFFKNVLDIFEADDLTILNYEGTLTTETDPITGSKAYCFRGAPGYAGILKAGSVEAVNLANNHSMDFRERGFEDTQAALDEAGVLHFGRATSAVYEVKGVKIGLLGYYAYQTKQKNVVAAIEQLRPECDILVVSLHWGIEGNRVVDKKQVRLGHAAINAGADLVLGHHPHVVQGIEKYKGKYIAYSLGNFCFGGNQNPVDKDSFIFQQTFVLENGTLTDGGIHVIPCKISSTAKTNNYQPTPVTGRMASAIKKKIRAAAKGLKGKAKF